MAIIESTLVLEYTRSTRRLINLIVEIHGQAGQQVQRIVSDLSQKNWRSVVISANNLVASFRFRWVAGLIIIIGELVISGRA